MKRIGQTTLNGLIRFYQKWISPLLGPRCRFQPTCSQYALEAIQAHGTLKGSWLGTKRLCKCHPLGSSGFDPVPTKEEVLQQRLNKKYGKSPSLTMDDFSEL